MNASKTDWPWYDIIADIMLKKTLFWTLKSSIWQVIWEDTTSKMVDSRKIFSHCVIRIKNISDHIVEKLSKSIIQSSPSNSSSHWIATFFRWRWAISWFMLTWITMNHDRIKLSFFFMMTFFANVIWSICMNQWRIIVHDHDEDKRSESNIRSSSSDSLSHWIVTYSRWKWAISWFILTWIAIKSTNDVWSGYSIYKGNSIEDMCEILRTDLHDTLFLETEDLGVTCVDT